MGHEERPPQKEKGPKRTERNIILQKNIAPCDLAKQFNRSGPANDRKREIVFARCLCDHAHFVAKFYKLAREKIGNRLDAADARGEMV